MSGSFQLLRQYFPFLSPKLILWIGLFQQSYYLGNEMLLFTLRRLLNDIVYTNEYSNQIFINLTIIFSQLSAIKWKKTIQNVNKIRFNNYVFAYSIRNIRIDNIENQKMTETVKSRLDSNKQCNLSKSKSAANFINLPEKLTEAIEMNNKLKELLKSIQTNAVYKKIESKQQSEISCNQMQIGKLKKKQGKLISEIEQLTNNLNVLVNQNYKLKLQVDSSRNSRAIYSNVYKTLEKQIRKNEYLYKMAIIEGMTFREIEAKVKEKVQKAVRKIEKQLNQLQGVEVIRKKQKYKSRVDTGFSTTRGNKVNSKETNRNSSKDEFQNRLQTKRDEIIQDSNFIKKQVPQRKQQKRITLIKLKQQIQKTMRTQKSMKTRNKLPIPQEQNQYFNLQMKSNYYDNIVMQLNKIYGQNTLLEIAQCWNNIDKEIQKQYKNYEEIEQKMKTIEKDMEQLQLQSKIHTKQDLGVKSPEERDLQEIEQQIRKQQQKMKELEAKLSEKIDFNCSKLTNQEITHHILRMKNQNQVSQRQLQKLLQSVCKQKNTSLMCSRMSESGR